MKQHTEELPDIEPGLRRTLRVGVRRAAWRMRGRIMPLVKRTIDILVSACAIVLGAPLLAIVSLAIRIDSKGPIFFSQTRVGRGGRHFRLWKFRSMHVDAEARRRALESEGEMSGGVRFKMKRDPRITTVGRLLRISSLDEAPQLWNVFVGDMTLVGPRPPIPSEVAMYDRREWRRLEGVPGLTCIWQVSGRSEIPFDRQVDMDIDYLHRQSILTDLTLILKTIPAVLFGRGAY